MDVSKTIGLASVDILFEEESVSLSQKNERFSAFNKHGYQLLAKHLSREIFLFKSAEKYKIVSVTEQNLARPALGIIVDDAEQMLRELYAKQLDIFDGGVVGNLALRLPAFRDKDGRYIYLIEKHRIDNFFAYDFKLVNEPHDEEAINHAGA